jgi:hypothetical protein
VAKRAVLSDHFNYNASEGLATKPPDKFGLKT